MHKKSFWDSSQFVLLVTFLFGWVTYNLKLVSINKLLGDMSFELYPYLILGQGILLLITFNVFKKIAEKSELFFYLIAVLIGGSTVFLSIFENLIPFPKFYFFLIIFFSSNLMIQAFDICMRTFSTQRVSLLMNPKFSILILLSYESGIIIGSLSGMLENFISKELLTITQTIPFLILIFILTHLRSNEEKVIKNKTDTKRNITKVPFFKLGLFLFTIVIFTKNIQGFATILAIKSLSEQSAGSLSSIFSKISFVQTFLIIIFLVGNYFNKKKSSNWTIGFYVLMGFQVLAMILLAIFVNPIFIIGLGIIRKIINHTIYSDAQNLFDASLPSSYRLLLKNSFLKIGTIIGLIALSFLSYAVIHNYISRNLVWLLTALIAFTSFVIIKKLLQTFNHFHLNQITNFQKSKSNDIPEIVNSTYALANKSAYKANLTLMMVITQMPPLPLLKALFYSLGEIREIKSIKILKKQYIKQEKELVKVEIIQALSKYDIKFFTEKEDFLNASVVELLSAKNFPHVSKHLFVTLFNLHPKKTIEVIKESLSNENISLDILLYLFYLKQDNLKYFESSLINIFEETQDNRVKLLTSQVLFKLNDRKDEIVTFLQEEFDSKKNFEDTLHVIGNLNLSIFLHKVVKKFRTKGYNHLSLLYCALTLGYEQAGSHIIKILRNGDPFSLPNQIKEFYFLEDKYRFQIYKAFFDHDKDFLFDLIQLLTEHENDFSNDITLIYKEAKRRLIELPQYEYTFKEY